MTTSSPRIVLHDPVDVEVRLRDLGLPPFEVLREAVAIGQAARNSCTPNDPPSSVGIGGWGKTVRGLRDNTLAIGWQRHEDDNIQGIINEPQTSMIAVTMGDEATGVHGRTPRTKYPKGTNTKTAVRLNRKQLSLFDRILGARPMIAPEEMSEQRLMWLLLVRPVEGEVRCELSLPDSIAHDDHIEDWRERLILAPLPIDGAPRVETEPGTGPDVEVVVTRRVG